LLGLHRPCGNFRERGEKRQEKRDLKGTEKNQKKPKTSGKIYTQSLAVREQRNKGERREKDGEVKRGPY